MRSSTYFDESHEEMRRTARDFTAKEIAPHLRQWEDDGVIPREVTERAGAVGLTGLGYPESAGGAGGDLLHVAAMIEGILDGGGSIGAMTALLSHGIVAPALLAAGDEEQIRRWVRPVLAGEMLCALAITEPDTGSDVANIRTRARRDGGGYVLDGRKLFISNGSRADFVLTAAVTGERGHEGLSLLVVEADTPGFSVAGTLEKMGWWCSDTAELVYDGCRVPADSLVGQENAGFAPIMRNFDGERVLMAVQCYATAQRCLELSVGYAQQREAFGRPLVGHQVLRHKLAEMARRTDVAREYALSVADRHRRGETVTAAAAMAKNTAVDALAHVVDEAVQIHGGAGYLRDSEVERHYRDARVMGIGGGTSEIMNEIIAKRLLGGG